MKIIITLISIIGLQYLCAAQSMTKYHINANLKSSHLLVVAPVEKPEVVRAKFTSTPKNTEVTIKSLPPVTDALTSVNMNFGIVGSFVFKKDVALEIPFNQEVFIEDKLTGKIFNIKTSESYTFTAEENIPSRFVMHILDKTEAETVVSAN